MMMFDGVLLIFALPPITAAIIMLLFDRQLGALFRYAGRWLGIVVATPLLVLRPPRGVRHGPAGLRHHLRGRARLFAESDLRLRVRGRRHGRDRRDRDGGLGSSHVHRRHERCAGCDFFRRHISDRRAHRHQDVQLDRHDLRRPAVVGLAHVVRPGLSGDVSDRRADRHHAGRGTHRLAGKRHLLRGRALSLRSFRRQPVCHHGRLLLLVSQGHRAA